MTLLKRLGAIFCSVTTALSLASCSTLIYNLSEGGNTVASETFKSRTPFLINPRVERTIYRPTQEELKGDLSRSFRNLFGYEVTNVLFVADLMLMTRDVRTGESQKIVRHVSVSPIGIDGSPSSASISIPLSPPKTTDYAISGRFVLAKPETAGIIIECVSNACSATGIDVSSAGVIAVSHSTQIDHVKLREIKKQKIEATRQQQEERERKEYEKWKLQQVIDLAGHQLAKETLLTSYCDRDLALKQLKMAHAAVFDTMNRGAIYNAIELIEGGGVLCP